MMFGGHLLSLLIWLYLLLAHGDYQMNVVFGTMWPSASETLNESVEGPDRVGASTSMTPGPAAPGVCNRSSTRLGTVARSTGCLKLIDVP